jgi:hypothetical protein
LDDAVAELNKEMDDLRKQVRRREGRAAMALRTALRIASWVMAGVRCSLPARCHMPRRLGALTAALTAPLPLAARWMPWTRKRRS